MKLIYKGQVISGGGQSGEGGTNDHTQLINRDAENQHPIDSISGLNEISNTDVLRMWNGA